MQESFNRVQNSSESSRFAQTEPRAARTVIHTVSASGGQPVIHGYVYPHTAEDEANTPRPDEEYTPESALLHRVRIFRWKSKYPYYEDFVRTAETLLDRQGRQCEHIPFFSYVPQYSQMNRRQLAWYLYLRECIRNGQFPNTDYSYVLLLVYEIINLSARIPPEKGQELLCAVWAGYRERFRQLDHYLPEWICDYSLIHRLPPPDDLQGELLAQIMQHCALKEFYVSGEAADGYVWVLLTFCCNYDYRNSKFCTPENRELFDRTVTAVLRQAIDLLSESGKLFSASGMEDSRLTRDAYSGALCSWRVKRKIEISYCSFSRSHELRFLITDIVKYTENKLRVHLGVRSRLTIYALPVRLRECIDACTADLLPVKTPEKKRQTPPEYERLYDLPVKPLSFSDAADIERRSWNTTQKLVEAFAESGEDTGIADRHNKPDRPDQYDKTDPYDSPSQNGQSEHPYHPDKSDQTDRPEKAGAGISVTKDASEGLVTDRQMSPPSEDRNSSSDSGLTAVLLPYRGFLCAVLRQNTDAQRSEAEKLGRLPDAVIDEINELAADQTGDILLEDTGDGIRVIEDYRHLLDGWNPPAP